METGWIIFIIVTVVLIGAIVALSIFGKKLQKKQEESEVQMRQGAQAVSIFVIEKKRSKLLEAGLPQVIIDQTPKYLRRSKLPVVKARVGNRIVNLMCDERAFQLIPEKKEVKVLLNGIYIVEAKGARGGLMAPPKKMRLRDRLRAKADKLSKEAKNNASAKASKK